VQQVQHLAPATGIPPILPGSGRMTYSGELTFDRLGDMIDAQECHASPTYSFAGPAGAAAAAGSLKSMNHENAKHDDHQPQAGDDGQQKRRL